MKEWPRKIWLRSIYMCRLQFSGSPHTEHSAVDQAGGGDCGGVKCCLRLCRWMAAGRWIACALLINNNNFIYKVCFLKQSFVRCRKYTQKLLKSTSRVPKTKEKHFFCESLLSSLI